MSSSMGMMASEVALMLNLPKNSPWSSFDRDTHTSIPQSDWLSTSSLATCSTYFGHLVAIFEYFLFTFDPFGNLIVIDLDRVSRGVKDVSKIIVTTTCIAATSLPIISLLVNKPGTLLVYASHNSTWFLRLSQALLFDLFSDAPPNSTHSPDNTTPISLQLLGHSSVSHGVENVLIYKIAWHPISHNHLLILSNDQFLRLYNLKLGFSHHAEQIFDLYSLYQIPIQSSGFTSPFSPHQHHPNPIDFVSFATSSPQVACWEMFTVYLISENHQIFALCPLIPNNILLPMSIFNQLEQYTRQEMEEMKSMNSITSSNFRARLAWISSMRQEMGPRSTSHNRILNTTNSTWVRVSIVSGPEWTTLLQGPMLIESLNSDDDENLVCKAILTNDQTSLQSSKIDLNIVHHAFPFIALHSIDDTLCRILILVDRITPLWQTKRDGKLDRTTKSWPPVATWMHWQTLKWPSAEDTKHQDHHLPKIVFSSISDIHNTSVQFVTRHGIFHLQLPWIDALVKWLSSPSLYQKNLQWPRSKLTLTFPFESQPYTSQSSDVASIQSIANLGAVEVNQGRLLIVINNVGNKAWKCHVYPSLLLKSGRYPLQCNMTEWKLIEALLNPFLKADMKNKLTTTPQSASKAITLDPPAPLTISPLERTLPLHVIENITVVYPWHTINVPSCDPAQCLLSFPALKAFANLSAYLKCEPLLHLHRVAEIIKQHCTQLSKTQITQISLTQGVQRKLQEIDKMILESKRWLHQAQDDQEAIRIQSIRLLDRSQCFEQEIETNAQIAQREKCFKMGQILKYQMGQLVQVERMLVHNINRAETQQNALERQQKEWWTNEQVDCVKPILEEEQDLISQMAQEMQRLKVKINMT